MPAKRYSIPGQGTVTEYANPRLKDARALASLVQGQATDQQQKDAWNFITLHVCSAARDSFVPNDPHATAYLAGRRSVAIQLAWILSQKPDIFRDEGEKE